MLKYLNFTLQAGEKIGIVGRSGAGKSSIVMSLLRMIDYSRGSIVVDGQDVSRVDL